MIDMVRLAAAIDTALPLLDAAGKDEHAHVLRTQSTALFRLARLGERKSEAQASEPQPSTDVHPKTDAITRTTKAPAQS